MGRMEVPSFVRCILPKLLHLTGIGSSHNMRFGAVSIDPRWQLVIYGCSGSPVFGKRYGSDRPRRGRVSTSSSPNLVKWLRAFGNAWKYALIEILGLWLDLPPRVVEPIGCRVFESVSVSWSRREIAVGLRWLVSQRAGRWIQVEWCW